MPSNQGCSIRAGRALSAVFVVLSVGLLPARSGAQSGWAQSVPPDAVLRFRPRTIEQASHPPRVPVSLTGRAAARGVATPFAPSPDLGTWQAWGPPALAWHALVRDSRRGVFLIAGGIPALDPQA